MDLPQPPGNDRVRAERHARWRSGWSRGHYIIARTVVGLILVVFGVGVPAIQDPPEATEVTRGLSLRWEARYLLRLCGAIRDYEQASPETKQLRMIQLEDVIDSAPPDIPTTPLAPALTRAQQIAYNVRLTIGLQALTIGIGDCGKTAAPVPLQTASAFTSSPAPPPSTTGAGP